MRCHVVIVVMLIASLLLAPGCAHKYVQKVAIFAPREQARQVEPAPRSGMYKVQLVGERGQYLKTPLYAADRWVKKGDPIGFERMEDGRLLAIAGAQELELGVLPPAATHVMWYHKSKQPTQFAKSAGKFGSATAQLAILTAAGAGIIAGTAALIWLRSQSDDCDDAPALTKHDRAR